MVHFVIEVSVHKTPVRGDKVIDWNGPRCLFWQGVQFPNAIYILDLIPFINFEHWLGSASRKRSRQNPKIPRLPLFLPFLFRHHRTRLFQRDEEFWGYFQNSSLGTIFKFGSKARIQDPEKGKKREGRISVPERGWSTDRPPHKPINQPLDPQTQRGTHSRCVVLYFMYADVSVHTMETEWTTRVEAVPWHQWLPWGARFPSNATTRGKNGNFPQFSTIFREVNLNVQALRYHHSPLGPILSLEIGMESQEKTSEMGKTGRGGGISKFNGE